ncbi:MAG: hypothetical protein M1836_003505 [Candelina mexicana]|nr:MAG: hypothetical protein M1836_003505 [Candelina mexicana]
MPIQTVHDSEEYENPWVRKLELDQVMQVGIGNNDQRWHLKPIQEQVPDAHKAIGIIVLGQGYNFSSDSLMRKSKKGSETDGGGNEEEIGDKCVC